MDEYKKAYFTLFNNVSDTIVSVERVLQKAAGLAEPQAREALLTGELLRTAVSLKMAQRGAEEQFLKIEGKQSTGESA